jgi:hypothetical protein
MKTFITNSLAVDEELDDQSGAVFYYCQPISGDVLSDFYV